MSAMFSKLLFSVTPFRHGFATHAPQTRVGLLGVPLNRGIKVIEKTGTELAPDMIRDGGLVEEIESFDKNVDLKDFGDLRVDSTFVSQTEPKNMHHYNKGFQATMHRLTKKVCEIRGEDRVCVTLGGDHAIAVGTISGQLKSSSKLSVLYVDAHADLNTNLTSGSGNIHGMDVAMVADEMSEFWKQLPGFDWQQKKLSLRNLAYIGLRSVDPMERFIAEKFNIKMLGMREVDRYGINKCIEMALDHIDPGNDRDYHISFDIDALDRIEAPSTGYSLPGGLTLREGITIIEEVYNSGRLCGLDVVEVCPKIGDERDVKRTIDSAIQLVKAACGSKRSGNLPSTPKNGI